MKIEINTKEIEIDLQNNTIEIYLSNGDIFSLEIDTEDAVEKLQELGLVPNTKEEAMLDNGTLDYKGDY